MIRDKSLKLSHEVFKQISRWSSSAMCYVAKFFCLSITCSNHRCTNLSNPSHSELSNPNKPTQIKTLKNFLPAGLPVLSQIVKGLGYLKIWVRLFANTIWYENTRAIFPKGITHSTQATNFPFQYDNISPILGAQTRTPQSRCGLSTAE